jgi:hypothetical protein
MSNSEVNRKRYTVVRNLSRMSVLQKIEAARHYVIMLTGNAHFTTPVPALVDVLNDALLLEQAQEAAIERSPVAISTLRNRQKQLDFTLTKLAYYVEGVANDDTTPDILIRSAGMVFRISEGNVPRSFSVKNGKLKGTALAVTKSEKGSTSYVWQYRSKGSPTWLQAAITVKASYLFPGLVSQELYEFRQMTITSQGVSDFTDAVELVIL